MLACMVAGFWLVNVAGRRAELHELLHSCLPPLLGFFFYSTGTAMRVQALRRSWPTALTLFSSRTLAIWLGNWLGVTLAARGRHTGADDGAADGACEVGCYGWAAYVTQAGITLGLSDEIAASFPTWGPSLQAPLISSVVLTQIVGPPLLKMALTISGESLHLPSALSRTTSTRRLVEDPRDTAEIRPAAHHVARAGLGAAALDPPPLDAQRNKATTADASDTETHTSFALRDTTPAHAGRRPQLP